VTTPAATGTNASAEVSGWRRWVAYVLLTAIFGAACVALGIWQLNRRAETVAEITRVQANYDAAPVPLGDLLPTPGSENLGATWRPVTVTGTYAAADQVLVRNRTSEAGPGFEILTPLVTKDGTVFVVDRGWIDKNDNGTGPGAVPAPPEGVVVVTARLRNGERGIPGQSASANLVPTIELDALAARWGVPLYTQMYGELISENSSAEAGALLAKPTTSEGNHLSYAFQWMAFAVLGIVALLWAVRREQRIRSGTPEEKARPSRARADDSDAEDDLVDQWTSQR
jgi:cytochrome oxidase assembly protein ShyY1